MLHVMDTRRGRETLRNARTAALPVTLALARPRGLPLACPRRHRPLPAGDREGEGAA